MLRELVTIIAWAVSGGEGSIYLGEVLAQITYSQFEERSIFLL